VIEVDGRDPSAVQKAVAKALASRSPTLVLASVGAAAES
jgi:TPP-dependent pyruvate/acetoin dehydrogenase alpha subunit